MGLLSDVGRNVRVVTAQVMGSVRSVSLFMLAKFKIAAKEASQVFLYHYLPLDFTLSRAKKRAPKIKASRLGLIGFFFIAPFSWAVALIKATVVNSFFTGLITSLATGKYLFFKSEMAYEAISQIKLGNDNRVWWQKYLLGAPSLIIGPLAALAAAIIYRIGEVLVQSFNALYACASFILNAVNSDGKEIRSHLFRHQSSEDSPHWFKRYGMGAPGFVLGTMLGVTLSVVSIAYKLTKHTLISFRFLSGAYLNMSLAILVLKGVDDDKRSTIRKTYGSVGYLLATIVTFPLSLIIYTVRKSPDILGAVVGVAMSPLVALYKGVRGNKDNLPKSGDKVMTKFRYLKNNLTASGMLPEGKDINAVSSHINASTAFMAKSMTLDLDTPTEKTINAAIDAYKSRFPQDYQQMTVSHPEFFEGDEFFNIVQKVTEQYAPDCFSSVSEVDLIQANILEVAGLISRYMNSEEESIHVKEGFYKTRFEPSFFALFSGSCAVKDENNAYAKAQPDYFSV